MVRHTITIQELTDNINSENATWLGRAKAKTNEFRTKGFYEEDSSIWSEVKPVYMRLQNEKCAYCERQMEAVEIGRIEQDVEHFRPKGNINSWKASAELVKAGIKFAAPPAKSKGYHLLPYHIFNYAAACKPCNSTLKKDYFPIGGAYDLDADDPKKLKKEKAYLLYPIGDIDDDPEAIITFQGVSPKPVASKGINRDRALVTIEFFKLDDPSERKNLYRDRAILITALFPLLEKTQQGSAAQKKKAVEMIDKGIGPHLRHLNCARSFRKLYFNNKAEARKIYDAATELMLSMS